MSATLLHGRRTGGDDLAIDRPDEGGELARDRGHGDGLRLASSGQRPIPRTQAGLRPSGHLPDRSGRGRPPLPLFLSPPPRVVVAPPAPPPKTPAPAGFRPWGW